MVIDVFEVNLETKANLALTGYNQFNDKNTFPDFLSSLKLLWLWFAV